MKYVVLSIVILLIACGGGPSPSNANVTDTNSVNPVEITKAKATAQPESASKTTTSLKAMESTSQDPSMTKEQLDKAKAIISKVTLKDIEEVNAGKLFKMHCALCHGFKGNMKINGAKDLTKSVLPIHEAVAQVYFGKGLMNPYKGVLEDAEIVAVCQYIEKNLRK